MIVNKRKLTSEFFKNHFFMIVNKRKLASEFLKNL